MSRQLSAEVENLLQLLIDEHRKLLKHVESQQAAMKSLDLKAMDAAAQQQEASRLRIATLENRRRQLCVQLARVAKMSQQEMTVKKLAELNPQRAPALLALRDELREVIGEIQKRTHIAGRLAGAVLGHLNTVVRILAGAVEQATGVYTKHGTPHVATRIGVMDAVG
jgi:hypothetical protein